MTGYAPLCAAALLLGSTVLLAGCGRSSAAADRASLKAAAAPCTLPFTGPVPPDVSIGAQSDADCFAWQEFVALNQPAAGGGFGRPGDVGAVQWQTYMNSHQLFQPDGAPPPPWGTRPAIDPACLREAGLTGASARDVIPMTMTSAFQSEIDEGDSAQAAPQHGPAWVADVRGNNLWYEVHVDRQEYDTILANKLFNRNGQAAWYAAHANQALQLPLDNPRGAPPSVGALEVKAAWMRVPDPANAKWRSYKVSQAVVVNPKTQKCVAQTVALVGLHIIHKTQSQPTWIWATFEHKDNAPDAAAANAPPTQAWNFYNPVCAARTISVPAACRFKGQATATISCTANQPPQYYIGQGCPAPTPIQVTRATPIDPVATGANTAAAAAIQGAYPGSVWSNYRLVNALWSSNPPPGQKPTVPQVVQSLVPGGPLANTTLETYAQTTKCTDCHKFAAISGNANLPSDFSFAFQEAQPAGAQMLLKASGSKRSPIRRRIDR